jgi:pyruvate dehydrogenase E2 component (dihydrolipoamide acetyltransferase)
MTWSSKHVLWQKNIQSNSQWKEEAITINHHVNIGVAVAVEDGLVVPVLNLQI